MYRGCVPRFYRRILRFTAVLCRFLSGNVSFYTVFEPFYALLRRLPLFYLCFTHVYAVLPHVYDVLPHVTVFYRMSPCFTACSPGYRMLPHALLVTACLLLFYVLCYLGSERRKGQALKN